MKAMSIRDVANNPVQFLRLIAPLSVELGQVKQGDQITVFEVLADGQELIERGEYTEKELRRLVKKLGKRALHPFDPDVEVRLLAHQIERNLIGLETFKGGFSMAMRLRAAAITLEQHQRPIYRRFRLEIIHLLQCHGTQTAGNQYRLPSVYTPPM